MYRNGKLDSLWGSVMPKIRNTSKKASNRSCSELNFIQKSFRAHMSISPRSGAWGFSISVYYKISNVLILWSPSVALVGEIDICAHGHFCTKFNSKQLLFEPFFDVMRIFGGIEPQSESDFPYLYKISNTLIFGTPSSTRGEDKHMRLRTFWYKIQF